jgi:hypothetical protein
MDSNRALIETEFATIWPAQISGFTRMIIQLRKAFDGDLDMMLVLAAIGDRTRPENWARELVDYGALISAKTDRARQYAVNAQSISDFTGIPRETVRRKLAALQKRGWIERDDKGCIAATGNASSDLQPATTAAIDYLAVIATAFDVARENAPSPPRQDGPDDQETPLRPGRQPR